jgi:hypothetical protein
MFLLRTDVLYSGLREETSHLPSHTVTGLEIGHHTLSLRFIVKIIIIIIMWPDI